MYEPQAPDSPPSDLCWRWQMGSDPRTSDEWIEKLKEIEREAGLDWMPGGVSKSSKGEPSKAYDKAFDKAFDNGYIQGYEDARMDARLDEARRNSSINALPSHKIVCTLPLYSTPDGDVDLLAYEEL